MPTPRQNKVTTPILTSRYSTTEENRYLKRGPLLLWVASTNEKRSWIHDGEVEKKYHRGHLFLRRLEMHGETNKTPARSLRSSDSVQTNSHANVPVYGNLGLELLFVSNEFLLVEFAGYVMLAATMGAERMQLQPTNDQRAANSAPKNCIY